MHTLETGCNLHNKLIPQTTLLLSVHNINAPLEITEDYIYIVSMVC